MDQGRFKTIFSMDIKITIYEGYEIFMFMKFNEKVILPELLVRKIYLAENV